MVECIVSNDLEIVGLPKFAEDWFERHCHFSLTAFPKEDLPDSILLFERTSNSIKIPRGLLSDVVSFCVNQKLPYNITYATAPAVPAGLSIAPHVNYTSGLYGYQGRVVNELMKYSTVRLQAPTGAGKTVISCLLAGLLNKGPLLFLANKDRLLRQFLIAVKDVLGIPMEDVGIIKAEKFSIKPITVGSLQTIGREGFDLEAIKNTFHVVIFDECHISSALTYRKVLLGLAPRHLIGLSATPEHYASDSLNNLMNALLGPIAVQVNESEIPGNLIPETVTRETGLKFSYKAGPKVAEMIRFKCRNKLYDDIASSQNRNDIIVKDCCKLVKGGFKCLITVQRVYHGRIIADLLRHHGVRVSFPYEFKTPKKGKKQGEEQAKVDHDQLDEDVFAIERGEIDVLIGTYTLFNTGFDCKPLSALLLAAPFSGKNTTQIEQAAGRVRRRAIGKDKCVILDYTDDSGPFNVVREWANDRADYLIAKFANHTSYP